MTTHNPESGFAVHLDGCASAGQSGALHSKPALGLGWGEEHGQHGENPGSLHRRGEGRP